MRTFIPRFQRLALATLFFAAWPALHAQQGRLTLQDIVSLDPLEKTALSPDGKTFAFARGGQIQLLPASGGWPTTLTSTAGAKAGIAWSPDGKQLAYASQGNIWVVAVVGGAPRRLTSAAAGSGDPRLATDLSPMWSKGTLDTVRQWPAWRQ